jgi:2-methylaconitate cis-trans-isomerase PrpF
MDGRIRCVIMRGGTSKTLFFAARDLPSDPKMRDAVILAAFGSPDVRQIDGLGGADPLTSKLAIIAPSERSDADVDYTFGQVGIVAPSINYRVNCGNTAAAVGVYAIQEGLVPAVEGKTQVRIFSTNSNKLIVAEVPTRNGAVVTEGDFCISGVPRPGAEIPLKFLEPTGGVTGRLLPSGAPVDEIAVRGGARIKFSLVDCGNLYAIIPAETWALAGSELPAELEAKPGFKAQIEEIRDAICQELLPDSETQAATSKPSAKLKIAIVGPAASYTTAEGRRLDRSSMDIVARIINQERVHKTFAVTGAINVAAAASIPGTVVNELCPVRDYSRATLRIGHPQGLIEPVIESTRAQDRIVVHSVQVSRTARRIMDGFVYIPATTAA